MVVDAGDTGVLLILFLITLFDYVASLGGKAFEEVCLLPGGPALSSTGEYKNAYFKVATAPNAEGLKTNHHHTHTHTHTPLCCA